MANFLQISEPEAAELDAQAYSQAQAAQRARTTSNALVSQYGPVAADPAMYQQGLTANMDAQIDPLKVQQAQLEASQNQRADQAAQAQHTLAFIRQQIANGTDPGDALASLTPETYAALGVDPTHVAPLVDAVKANPKLLDQIGDELAPLAAKSDLVDKAPQWATDASGHYHALYAYKGGDGKITYQEAGGLPAGYSLMGLTPAQAANADVKAGVMPPWLTQTPTNQGDALKRAILGQESGGNPGVGNSSAGARGIGQIMPATFAQYAKPGESITNPADNAAVSGRILDDYMGRYGDPARAAVAYFSGPGNVAPPGSKTPWLHDAKDTDGTKTSQYVAGVLGRMGAGAGAMPTQALTPMAQAAQQRAATQAQRELRLSQTGEAQVSPQTVDYLAQRFRTSGSLPAMGMGGAALRAQVFARAAEMAKADGSDGQADVFAAQATKERGTAVDDLGKSTPNSAGGRIQSVGALVAHMDQLSTLGVQLTSGNLPLLNRARQAYQQATGQPAPTNFNAVKVIAANEAAKFLAGAQYTQVDRQQAQHMFDTAQSPAQLNGALSNVQQLVVGQLTSMRQRYQAVNAAPAFDATLTPRVRQLMGLTAAPAGAAPAAPAAPAASTAALRAKYGLQ